MRLAFCVIARPLQIGPLGLATNLMLAPIAGWCELAWRVTCREIGGVGLASTDLLSPKGLLCSSEAGRDLARTHDLDQPIGMQLYGSDPGVIAEGARWCADHGASLVDINMGCPVDKVCKKDGGSRLMCDPDRAVRIADATRAALPEHIPLTAKMRLGWTDADAARNLAGELACRLVEVGVAAITVHGRTTEQRFKGHCRAEGIARVVEAVDGRVPVIGNGDVRTPADALAMLERTGCAGVMIGRGAFGNPWIFREAWHAQLVGAGRPAEPLPSLSDADRIEVIRAYFQRMREFRDDRHAVHVIRQKISWLGRTVNAGHCKALREGVRLSRTPDEVLAALDAYLDSGPQRRDERAASTTTLSHV